MTRKKWCLIGAAILGLSTAGVASVNPIAERYVAPMVQEQINTSINGSIQYDSMHIGWDGDIVLHNVVIRDEDHHLVATVPEATVALKLTSIPSILMGDASGARIVSSVTLDKPDVHIWQLQDKSWNVESLIKPSEDSSKESFDGHIVVDDGTVVLRLKEGNTHQLTHLSGAMSINLDGMSSGAITTELDGQSIALKGSIDMNQKDDFDLFVQSNSINIEGYKNLVPIKQNITLGGGTLQDVKVQIKSQNGEYHLAGSVNVDDLSGTFKTGNQELQITRGNGRIFLQDRNILIARSSWLINNQEAKLNGLLSLQGDEVHLNLNGVVDSAQIEAFTDVGVTGTIGGRVHIGGTSLSPYVDGKIQTSGITYDGYSIDRGEASIVYDDGLVRVNDVTLFVGAGSIKGRGEYALDSGSFTGSANVHNVEMSPFTRTMVEPISGILNGTVSVEGAENKISKIAGSVRVKDLGVSGISIDTVDAQFTQQNNITTLSAVGHMGSGTLSAYGTYDNNQLDVNVSANQVDGASFSSFAGESLAGQINGYANIRGPLDNLDVQGHVSSDEIKYGTSRFNSIDLDFTMKNQVVTIENGVIGDGNGEYSLTGTIGLADKSLMLQANAKSVRIENLIRSFTDIPLTGWLDSENRITGTITNPYVVGRACLYDGSLYGKLVSSAAVEYTVQNKTLTMPQFTLEGYGATVHGSGTVSQDLLDINFEGNDIDMGRLLINTDYNVKGYVSAKGRLRGSIDSPIFEGLVNSKALHINNEGLFNIDGQVYVDKSVINLESFGFDDEHKGHYIAKGGMSLVGDKRLFGGLRVTNGSINDILRLAGKPIPNLEGALTGEVELGGVKDNPSVAVIGKIQDVAIDNKIVGDASIDMSLADRKFNIKTLKLPVDEGLIAMAGTMDLDGTTDMQLAMRSVDITPFLPLVGEKINATGKITGVVNITGETKNPKVELSASLADGSYNGIGIDEGFALATMQDHVIQIQRIQGAKGDYKLSVYGKIPLAALYTSGYLDSSDLKAMDVTIDFNEADMRVIPLVTDAVTDASGPLKGAIHITGTVDQPEAYGTVSVRNGTLKVKNVGNEIQNIDGDLIFSGQQGDFQSRISMGKGTAGLAAKVNWEGHNLTNYRMAVQLDGLDLKNEYVSGPLQGELYIADRDGLPTLMGDINLNNIQFKIPLSLESSDSTTDLGMDVTVHAGKNVRLYDKTLYDMMLGGDVHFGGSVLHPQSSGKFIVKNGTFKYFSHVFNITKGDAHFGGESYLPFLDLEAETTVNTYNIKLGVKGTVDHMDLALSSDPQLARNQIISMLTFGRDPSSNSSTITNDDANALAVAGAQMFAFGYVQDALQNTFRLDRVNITTGSIDPDEPTNKENSGNYNIEIGKYVLPRTMITYSQGLNNKQNKYGIEYSLRRSVKFNAWRTNQGSNYLGARWTKTF